MNWKKINSILFFSFFYCAVFAQSIDLEQIEQVWRPRIKVGARYFNPVSYSDTTGKYSNFEQQAVFTFPIKTKFKADASLDLSELDWQAILKNSAKTVRIEASQILGSVRFERREINIGFDSIPKRELYNFSASVFGLKLTQKFKILFYNASINHAEENKTLNKFAVRANAIGGRFHLRSTRKNFYYGALISYSDKSFLAVPFFGGAQPLTKKLTLNYTLPACISLAYDITKKWQVNGGVSADGYRSGIQLNGKRINLSNTNVEAYTNIYYKPEKSFQLKAELGYMLYSNMSITKSDVYQYNYPYKKGLYVQLTLSRLFGRTLFEKIVLALSPLK